MPRKLNYTYPELVKKAQYLFWIKGYKAVTNEDLASHLNVSVSTIYNKFTKDMLFMDSLNSYVCDLSDPVLTEIRTSDEGKESFRKFFYMLIDALLDKSFPRSCFMANVVMEMRNERYRVSEIYDRYYNNMKKSYLAVLQRAVDLNEIRYPERIEDYADFMIGIIPGLSILYKIKSRDELKNYIDEQLSLIE